MRKNFLIISGRKIWDRVVPVWLKICRAWLNTIARMNRITNNESISTEQVTYGLSCFPFRRNMNSFVRIGPANCAAYEMVYRKFAVNSRRRTN